MISLLLLAGIQAISAPSIGPAEVNRPVAEIVSPIWSDPAYRDAAREVDQIVTRTGLRPGMRLADIGAGSGYDTLRLARVVGPRGIVFAEDVTLAYLRRLKETVDARRLHNVRMAVGKAGDPMLPPRSVDVAIMVHMYHEVRRPMELLTRLSGAFRPGGRLGIEELDRPILTHGTPPKLLVCELAAAGYGFVSLKPMTGGLGYFAVFKPPAAPRPLSRTGGATCLG